MTTDELRRLQAEHPEALTVWYDRMFDLDKARLIETILFHIPVEVLNTSLQNIQKDIIEEKTYDH